MGLKAVAGTSFADPTFTGAAGFGDGTAGAPSIAWTSDQDGTGTGFYRQAANVISAAINGVERMRFDPGGNGLASGFFTGNSYHFASTFTGTRDTSITYASANSLVFGTASGLVTSRTEINKAVTAFTNAAAKATFTVTVPNAAHHATIEFVVQGALGAGGAIGAGEAMATNTYLIGIVRTAGVATVATATAARDAVAVAVAGAATVTATAAVSAMTGAVGATQTFTIDVTITRSGGSSDNHTALCYARLLNANATGITIA